MGMYDQDKDNDHGARYEYLDKARKHALRVLTQCQQMTWSVDGQFMRSLEEPEEEHDALSKMEIAYLQDLGVRAHKILSDVREFHKDLDAWREKTRVIEYELEPSTPTCTEEGVLSKRCLVVNTGEFAQSVWVQVGAQGFRFALGEERTPWKDAQSTRRTIRMLRKALQGENEYISYVLGGVDGKDLELALVRSAPEGNRYLPVMFELRFGEFALAFERQRLIEMASILQEVVDDVEFRWVSQFGENEPTSGEEKNLVFVPLKLKGLEDSSPEEILEKLNQHVRQVSARTKINHAVIIDAEDLLFAPFGEEE